eukprot:TRINITY_DN23466_c0_g1_i2.p1 TRINITY_DN23466_c0_g1~~TRINITY_DN23466_c0_g1_i2.p1  ORF type:complete len:361 (-),score=29.26 TRINITY_DN23466_c0_g1_i2:33-1058(-)
MCIRDSYLMSGSNDGKLKIWEIKNLILYKSIPTLKNEKQHFAKYSDRVVIICENTTIFIRNWMTDKVLLRHPNSHNKFITGVIFKTYIFTSSYDGVLRIWNVPEGFESIQLLKSLVFRAKIQAFQVLQNNEMVQVILKNRMSIVYNWEDNIEVRAFTKIDASKVYGLACLQNSSLLVPLRDFTIDIYPWKGDKPSVKLRGAMRRITSTIIDRTNPNFIWGVSLDETIRKWDLSNGNLVKVMKNHANFVEGKLGGCLFIEPLGLIAVYFKKNILVWNLFGELKGKFKVDNEITGIIYNTITASKVYPYSTSTYLIVAMKESKELAIIAVSYTHLTLPTIYSV